MWYINGSVLQEAGCRILLLMWSLGPLFLSTRVGALQASVRIRPKIVPAVFYALRYEVCLSSVPLWNSRVLRARFMLGKWHMLWAPTHLESACLGPHRRSRIELGIQRDRCRVAASCFWPLQVWQTISLAGNTVYGFQATVEVQLAQPDPGGSAGELAVGSPVCISLLGYLSLQRAKPSFAVAYLKFTYRALR